MSTQDKDKSTDYYSHQALAWAGEKPDIRALFKSVPEDFRVDEILNWDFSGEGEHLCVLIRKTGLTTSEVVQRLARAASVRPGAIGYSGLKDRQGICRQWFSIHLPGSADPELGHLQGAALQIERTIRNHRKIRRGSHSANSFTITLRELQDPANTLEQRLATIEAQGVPNYFGEQRFGIEGANVSRALAWFKEGRAPRKHFERSLLLSAARSAIFNSILSQRVAQASWNQYLPGDIMNLAGSDSIFVPELPESGEQQAEQNRALAQRVNEGDIHPTGALWGRGQLLSSGKPRDLEEQTAARFSGLCAGLEENGLTQTRRSLRLPVKALHYARPRAEELQLQFSLPPGAYATSVLREVSEIIQKYNRG